MKSRLDSYLESTGKRFNRINNKDLDRYIDTIVKRYKKFDGAHDDAHARMVIKNSEFIANSMMRDEKVELNMNMVKIIAVSF